MKTNEIYHGDAYKLIKEIPDNSVDLVYTDIPYDFAGKGGGGCFGEKKRDYHKEYEQVGINSNITPLSARKRKNNDENKDIAFGIDYKILDEFVRICKKTYVYIWCSKMQIPTILNYFVNKGCFFEIMFWGKTNPIPTANGTYLSDTEYCLMFREKETKIGGSYKTKSKFYISSINKKDKEWYDHPTIKPLELVKRHIINSSNEGDLIFDPFAGSGTTAVAAKELKRKYLTFELDDKFYNIAKDRLNGISQFEKKVNKETGQLNLFGEGENNNA